jgi:hypothetical protein
MDYASSSQSTKKAPTEEYDLVILGGARDQSLRGLSGVIAI